MQPDLAATASVPARPSAAFAPVRRAQEDPRWVRLGLTGFALAAVCLIVVVPIANVFAGAFAEGVGTYWKNLVNDRDTLHSILLTLTVVPLALVANVVFGVAAAWAVSRFSFPGRT